MDKDNEQGEALANRDSPIPVVVTSPQDASPSAQQWHAPSKPRRRSRSPIERLREKALDKMEEMSEAGSETGVKRSLQDRLLTKVFEQFIPQDPGEESEDNVKVKDRRSRKYVDRPGFSLPVMTNNFRRFNARIGVVFVAQNRIIRLFSWADPCSTLSFIAVYTLVVLNMNLLAIIPMASILFFIMVPAYIARHPSPPNSDYTELFPHLGPPTAAAKYIRPAQDMSKDFFRNLRDLQNAMEDFNAGHDKAIEVLAPLTNFSNEAISSTFFLILFINACVLFVAASLLPVRAVALVTGWFLTALGHPAVRALVFSETTAEVAKSGGKKMKVLFDSFSRADVVLDQAPEVREVEVFELQRREMYEEDSEFEPYIFSPSPYTPLSPSRVAGEVPKGTRFFEDVQPPTGWHWADKRWTLDLFSTEWVGDRVITAVEVETEGERWVSDIDYEEISTDDFEPHDEPSDRKGKETIQRTRTWEESNGSGRKGEWRRRRWVRLVQRKAYHD